MSGYIGIKKQWRLYELKPYLNQNIYQDEELRSLINENLRKLDKLEKKLEKAKRENNRTEIKKIDLKIETYKLKSERKLMRLRRRRLTDPILPNLKVNNAVRNSKSYKKWEETSGPIFLIQGYPSQLKPTNFFSKGVDALGLDFTAFQSVKKSSENLKKIQLEKIKTQSFGRRLNHHDVENLMNNRSSTTYFTQKGSQLLPFMFSLPLIVSQAAQGTTGFEVAMTEEEYGLRVGTPAFVLGTLVIDKTKKILKLENMVGYFKDKEELLSFLREEYELTNMLYNISFFLSITSFVILLTRVLNKFRRRRRRRRR
jgi:hypothetical protein